MPTIAASIVKKPRRMRYCENCSREMAPGNPTVKLYGCAYQGDPPYRVFICPECAEKSPDVKKALNH